ncbi:TlpA disulfide reductase family protein [Cytophagaceae bacterium DM2B3-1]|uniref:TlpA disulfide reductase family protein n=1 Tax=Xanthocytophaga flava TaxID=3048013 RepID=A0ABT7CRE4_9BACT|nr:TlpA disulfide reductase family protein [Xanthocytophaga flavus]MDJ1496323.1 TlpA disulfide reductase family protein [Xanthocytophaga flavus]
MKYYPILFLAIVFFACQLPTKTGFTINGNVRGLKVKKLYMKYMVNGVEKADTAIVTAGKFVFKGRVEEPEMAMIYSTDVRLQKIFYVENTIMSLTGSADSLDKLRITGSAVQADYEVFEKEIWANRKKVTDLYQQANAAKEKGDSVLMKELMTQSDILYNKEDDIRKNFIVTHTQSFTSLNELMNWANAANHTEAQAIYDKLDDKIKQTHKARELVERLESLKRAQVGQAAMDFTQYSLNGKEVNLSSYKGKYVLLEFWASWCGPCRQENPNLREAYLKYKDKGFDILGVSLDDNKDRWSKALDKDGLPWTQVSDLKGWRNVVAVQYGIRAIPANFLIDPQGKIIARDLRGEKLNEQLAKIFKW